MEEKLILELYKCNCIKLGNFKLKNGDTSHIYIDLKNIISYPYIINTITKLIYKKTKLLDFDRILGIPYGAIPIASLLSANYNYPMIMVRKELKKYGLKKLIEGEYNHYDKIIIIEDTISTGSSINEFIKVLKPNKFNIIKIITICDRRTEFKFLNEYSISSLITLKNIIMVLNKHKLLKNDLYSKISLVINKPLEKHIIYKNENSTLDKLINIISYKKSNICIILELTEFSDIIDYINLNHKTFCILKIYSEIIKDFTYRKGLYLKNLAQKYNFLIYEGKNFSTEKNIFLYELSNKLKYYQWTNIINIGFNYEEEIFNTIKYINIKHNKNLSVVYNDHIFNDKINKLLKNIIIGTTLVNFKNLFVFTTNLENNNNNNNNYINCIKNKY